MRTPQFFVTPVQGHPVADVTKLSGVDNVVALHTERLKTLHETRADLEAAFAGTELLVETPPGVAVEFGCSSTEP